MRRKAAFRRTQMEGKEMTVDEAKDMLAHFASRDSNRRNINKVRTLGKMAYATDGRIAFRATLDSEAGSNADEFPVKAIDEFMECVDAVCDKDWVAMDWDKFMKVGEKFMEELRAYEVEQRSNIRERYRSTCCPCCGADVYWDSDMEKLIELEDIEEVDYSPSHVDFPVRLNLQDGTFLDVAFGHLYLIWKAFGEDVLFSREIVKEGDTARLLLKAKNGAVNGVMMPIRAAEEDFVTKHIIDTHAHEGGVKEDPADGKAY